jgi:hypothetical protein
LIDLRNHAAETDANIVVSKIRAVRSVGFLAPKNTINGQSYNCPADVATKLTNAESL